MLVMYHTFKTGYILRYEVLTAVLPKIQVYWDGGPLRLVDDYWRLKDLTSYIFRVKQRRAAAPAWLPFFLKHLERRILDASEQDFTVVFISVSFALNKTGLSDLI
jgi:hypothetical protein